MTYSIVARDSTTGELGVAVQSHFFSVGSVVTWARPGIGAVATQANAEVAYGPRLLDLLAGGDVPVAALDLLLAEDPAAQTRQVAVVDAIGRVAAHTGTGCIPLAGHLTGEGFSCQANIMASERVWPEMAAAFSSARGPLCERLMAALEAAEQAGGDLRGRQSAAILVVPAQGEPWRCEMSLRVEDDPEPLAELRRLMSIHAAYRLASQADTLAGKGRHGDAAELFRQASELEPANHELRFWRAIGAAEQGDLDLAVAEATVAIAAHPPWLRLLATLPAEVAPSAPALYARLRAEGVA